MSFDISENIVKYNLYNVVCFKKILFNKVINSYMKLEFIILELDYYIKVITLLLKIYLN